MTVGEVAGLIAALAFLILVVLLGVPLLKLGKVLDETRFTVHDITKDVTPLLHEVTETVQVANRELDKIDGLTGKLVKTAENVTGIVATLTGVIESPLAKIAAFAGSFTTARRKAKRPSAKEDSGQKSKKKSKRG